MKIKNIVFDLGGVILNLDQEKTLRAFKNLGADLDEFNERLSIFKEFETGKIDAIAFTKALHHELKGNATYEQIEEAWNSMLLDLPPARVELIKELKKTYRLFLLSNTNTIHINEVYKVYGKQTFEALFEKIYYSQEIGLRKPDPECYQYVIDDAKLIASETVFIDDSQMNVKSAVATGMAGIWAKEPLDLWIDQELKNLEILQMN